MTDKKRLLLAAGGHGRVVLDTLLSQGFSVHGILDPGLSVGLTIFGVPVLGADTWLDDANPTDFVLVNGAGAAPASALRQRLFERWSARGFGFVALCHPGAIVAREVVLREGSQVMAGAIVQPRSLVGANAVVNTRASIDHDCAIDAHAFIAPGAVLCGGVRVGMGAFVGAGAVLLPGIKVGDRAVVGAGATVTRDVPAGLRVLGTPARPSNNALD
jgi:UDP-perosamine 4-acetyltransferase